MGLGEAEVREIVWSSELHDVGKAAIPDAILNKPGPLDPDEWKLIRRQLVRSSHERFDGAGYPDGLSGRQIPLGSRIIFVSDAFDANEEPAALRPAAERRGGAGRAAPLRRLAATQLLAA